LESKNPLSVCEGILALGFRLNELGVYHCEIQTNGNVLMARRLVAMQVPQAGKAEDQNDD
jgi:hypothetical protein